MDGAAVATGSPGFPKTLVEFDARFDDEDACVAYLRSCRWPQGFVCPKCAGTKSWRVRGRLEECAGCGKQTSITAGTVFHGTRKPLRTWFRALVLMLTSKQGCSALEMERLLGLAHQTAWTWAHKLRLLFDPAASAKLDGAVEIDETYLGGDDVAAHKGRSLAGKKVCVVAAVEVKGTAMGRARVELVADATARSLRDFAERNIAIGSTLHTDGAAAYRSLAKRGFTHRPEVIGNPKRAAKLFPHAHRIFSLVRRVLLATHQGAVRPQHLQRYLDEYVFRFNRRSSANRFLLVQRALDRAVLERAFTYAQITDRAVTL